jgi:hypothetical protein
MLTVQRKRNTFWTQRGDHVAITPLPILCGLLPLWILQQSVVTKWSKHIRNLNKCFFLTLKHKLLGPCHHSKQIAQNQVKKRIYFERTGRRTANSCSPALDCKNSIKHLILQTIEQRNPKVSTAYLTRKWCKWYVSLTTVSWTDQHNSRFSLIVFCPEPTNK